MAFFKRELSPVETFQRALKEKQVAQAKLGERLALVEKALEEKRVAAERLAKSGASNAQLDRADAQMRLVEEQTKSLRVSVAEGSEQVALAGRALDEAVAQRDRDQAADEIEAMAAAIEQAMPRFQGGAAGLVDAVARHGTALGEAVRFAGSVDEMRREVMSAADLLCWELRSAAVRTRAGNVNVAPPAAQEAIAASDGPDIERQMVYALNPLSWREGDIAKRAAAFTMVGLPKSLLATALQHQHVDHLNARRVQTLMHVHGSGELQAEPQADDPALVDLDALAADGQGSARADVA